MQIQSHKDAKNLVFIQLGCLILATLLLLPFDPTVSLSGLLGGCVAFFSTLIVYIKVFGVYRAQNPEKILAKFYGAAFVKLIFAIAAFAVILLNVQPLNIVALFIVYFFIQVIPALLVNFR